MSSKSKANADSSSTNNKSSYGFTKYGTALYDSDDEDDDDTKRKKDPFALSTHISEREKKKAKEEAQENKYLPIWKQEVRDEQGRRRFHGAFTGGFSAGYFNTVGSAEGFTPTTFISSRKQRASVITTDASAFMDEEDKQMFARNLTTRADFNTFGFTANELGKQAAAPSDVASGAIPGPIPNEFLIVGARQSIGVRLLRRMGWKQGQGIGAKRKRTAQAQKHDGDKKVYGCFIPPHLLKDRQEGETISVDMHADEEEGEEEEEVAPEDTHVVVFKSKNDYYGIGFDPHADAPEVREHLMRIQQQQSKSRGIITMKSALEPGGAGALEAADDDIYATVDMSQYDVELSSKPMADFRRNILQQAAENKRRKQENYLDDDLDFDRSMRRCSDGRYPIKNFVLATRTDAAYAAKWFEPPVVPKDFNPRHVFSKETLDYLKSIAPNKTLVAVTSSTIKTAYEPITAEQRSKLLGETLLPGKQDYVPQQIAPPAPAPAPTPTPAPAQQATWLFQHSAAIQSRFTTGSEQELLGDAKRPEQLPQYGLREGATEPPKPQQTPAQKQQQAEAAAARNRKITREEYRWVPESLVCKRFSVHHPYPGATATGTIKTGETKKTTTLADFMKSPDALLPTAVAKHFQQMAKLQQQQQQQQRAAEQQVAESSDEETEEAAAAATYERPSIDLFKAIFEDTDEEEEEEEEKQEHKEEQEAPKQATAQRQQSRPTTTAEEDEDLFGIKKRKPDEGIAAIESLIEEAVPRHVSTPPRAKRDEKDDKKVPSSSQGFIGPAAPAAATSTTTATTTTGAAIAEKKETLSALESEIAALKKLLDEKKKKEKKKKRKKRKSHDDSSSDDDTSDSDSSSRRKNHHKKRRHHKDDYLDDDDNNNRKKKHHRHSSSSSSKKRRDYSSSSSSESESDDDRSSKRRHHSSHSSSSKKDKNRGDEEERGSKEHSSSRSSRRDKDKDGTTTTTTTSSTDTKSNNNNNNNEIPATSADPNNNNSSSSTEALGGGGSVTKKKHKVRAADFM